MASGSQVTEEKAGGLGAGETQGVSSLLKQKIKQAVELGGAEIGLSSSENQLNVDELGRCAGGENGLASAEEQVSGAKIGCSFANEEVVAAVSGENGVASADQVTCTSGNLDAETRVSSDNLVNREAGRVGGENEVFSAYCVNDEPASGSTGDETGASLLNQVNRDTIGEACEEAGVIGSESGVACAKQVTGNSRGIGGEIKVVSTDHASEIGVAFANEVTGETQRIGGEIEGGSSNHVTEEAGSIVERNRVASVNQINGEAVGTDGGSKVPFADQVNAKLEGNGGEYWVVSLNQVTMKAVCSGGETSVPIVDRANEEAVSSGGEAGPLSSSQVNEEAAGSGGETRVLIVNQADEEAVSRGGESATRWSSQVNDEAAYSGSETRVPIVNQVNEEAGCVGGDIRSSPLMTLPPVNRWAETKVYRRRPKGEKNIGVLTELTTIHATKTLIDNDSRSQIEKMHLSEVKTPDTNTIDEGHRNNTHLELNGAAESDKIVSVPSSGDISNTLQMQPETVVDVGSSKELIATGVNCVTPIPVDSLLTNGTLNTPLTASDGKVKVNLLSTPKLELRQLKRKFESELYSVRKTVKKMDGGKEEIVPEFYHPIVNNTLVPNGARSNGFAVATQVYSGTRSLGHVPYKPNIRPFNQLRVSVFENSQGMIDCNEREKRTPKANTFYRNSEFLLANDKFPPAESNKKSKSNGQRSGGSEFGFGGGSKVYKSCSALLEKLMKHKHGWVFNAPVDVQALGLHDYFLFIKNLMDLGTVKTRLIKYWYKSPMEFAEDVRLTFHNAMLYNPKGHDVHVMAETLLKIFEGKWPDIEVKYLRELRSAVDHDMGFLTPTSRITNPFQSQTVPPLETRVLGRSESMPQPVNPKPRTLTSAPSFKAPALQKPKAKDVNKREMTYGEKQKLSTNLQGLPPEKMDGIIQIVKKRSTALSQNGDEIEVDIDSVDTETLWELDRYVSNWKKGLSKHRRRAEHANQMRAEARLAAEKAITTQLVQPRESTTGYENTTLLPPPHQKDPAANASGSSSSSSSSSSGSSSSDSDSDSSSDESDGGRSPET